MRQTNFVRAAIVVGAVVAAVVAGVGAFALKVELVGIPHYARAGVPDLRIEVTPERVSRGKRWAALLCAECHANSATGRLTGADMHLDRQFGKVYSCNITRDRVHGIGAWSDGDIAYMLRTGVARDGRYTPPWMAKLPHLADEDLWSIIAFLRSDQPEVAGSDVPSIPSRPNFFAKLLATVAFGPLPYPSRPVTGPPPGDAVALGRYLVWNLDCWTCHSPDFSTVRPLDPPSTPGFLSGGNPMENVTGERIVTTNLTPDVETGIGGWSEADFVRAVREGVRPDSTAVRAPMSTYSQLTVDEVGAIFAYLRTVPAIRHQVTRSPSAVVTPETAAGKRAFTRYACYSCHGHDGVGACDLTHNRDHFPADADLIQYIRDPASIVPGSRMPAWRNVIPEDELRSLVAHVRSLSR